MCGDTRSLIHGIINLIVPFFIYDLASVGGRHHCGQL